MLTSSSSLRTQSTSRSSQKRRGGAQKNRSKGSRGIQRSLSRDRHHKEPVARRNVDSVGDRRTGDRSRKFSNQSTERNGNRKVSLRGRERGRLMGSRSPSHSRDCHRSERGRPMQRGTGERHKGHSLQKSSRDMDNGNERDRSRGKSKRDPKSRSDEYWGGPEDRKEQSREKEKRLGSRERHGRSNYHNRPDSHNHRRPREINTDRRKSPVTKHRVRELSSSPAQGYHKRRKVESKDQARDDAPSQWTKPGNTERDSVPHPVEEAEPREPNGHGRRSGDAVQIPENAKENPQDSLLESSRWGSGPRRNTGSKDAGDGAPNFGLSGKLAEESRKVKGVVLKFTEPPEARKPDMRWRLYIFKGGDSVGEPIPIHRQSCYLFGRDRGIADIPTDHPSCSKQHSALQFRWVLDLNTCLLGLHAQSWRI